MVPPTGLRILLVEDDPDAQANMRDILEVDGHQVDIAGSLKSARDRQNWSDYQAVLLDRRLGDGAGDQLLQELRRLAPKAAIIVVTAYADLDSTIGALRSGAWDYILKPINPDALRASLFRVMQMQRSEARALQSERLAAVGEMTAILIHESRNAFHHSHSAMELLKRRVKEQPDALELIQRMERSQSRVLRLFQDVREYAAPIVLNRLPVNIIEVLMAAWNELSSQRLKRDITFLVNRNEESLLAPHAAATMAEDRDLVVSIDQERIQQVFRNLFENALVVCRDPVVLTVDIQCVDIAGGKELQISIRDNGPGIPASERERVFEPFFTTRPKGTGLGLAIARRVLETHGGRINAFSPGGAEFRISLPGRGHAAASTASSHVRT